MTGQRAIYLTPLDSGALRGARQGAGGEGGFEIPRHKSGRHSPTRPVVFSVAVGRPSWLAAAVAVLDIGTVVLRTSWCIGSLIFTHIIVLFCRFGRPILTIPPALHTTTICNLQTLVLLSSVRFDCTKLLLREYIALHVRNTIYHSIAAVFQRG